MLLFVFCFFRKEILNILKLEQAEEERKELKADWKLKRHQNNKKRQEFFNDNIIVSDKMINIGDTSKDSGLDNKPEIEEKKDHMIQVPVNSVILKNSDKIEENQDKMSDLNEFEDKIFSAGELMKLSELENNRSKVLGSNLIVSEDVTIPSSEKNDTIACPSKILNLVETTTAAKGSDLKYSELKENRLKVLGSNFIVGEDVPNSTYKKEDEKNYNVCASKVLNLVETSTITKDNDLKYSELQDNRLRVLGSNFIVDESQNCTSEGDKKNVEIVCTSKVLNLVDITSIKDKDLGYSELEINRMKSLHSDFERGNEAALLIYQDEAGKNKQKILGSHFTLGSDIIVEKIKNVNDNIEISQTNQNINQEEISKDTIKPSNQEEITESNKFEESIPLHSLDLEDFRHVNIGRINDPSNINVLPVIGEQNNFPCNEIGDHSDVTSEHIGVNGVSWFQKCNQHVEGVKNLFKANELINLPEQQIDYYSILKCVPGSLNLVLETQLTLVNEALLEMFFNELQLLTEAGKLKKYFFLDEEFGKKLTCSLCPAIEKEKPLTLLTFGRLRDVLAFASQGDEKLSFIVKETPTAFDHTNPQVL